MTRSIPSLLATQRLPWLFLAFGALAGLAFALGTRDPQDSAMTWPDDAVARVDTTYLREADVERVRNTTAQPGTREQVIDALIDEEVLVQHALDIDLLRQQPRVGQLAIDALITSLMADIDAAPASDETLRALYQADPRRFAPASPLSPPFERVRHRVERAYREQQREQALDAYVRWLRRRAELDVREPRP